jgi:tetratricopeptide (TPR) repeat protein
LALFEAHVPGVPAAVLSEKRYANCLSSLRAYLRDPSAGAVAAPDATFEEKLEELMELGPDARRFMEHQRRFEIREKALNVLAENYQRQGRYGEAEPLYKGALAIREMNFGRDDPAVATSLFNLAENCHRQGRYGEAKQLYERILAILQNWRNDVFSRS